MALVAIGCRQKLELHENLECRDGGREREREREKGHRQKQRDTEKRDRHSLPYLRPCLRLSRRCSVLLVRAYFKESLQLQRTEKFQTSKH